MSYHEQIISSSFLFGISNNLFSLFVGENISHILSKFCKRDKISRTGNVHHFRLDDHGINMSGQKIQGVQLYTRPYHINFSFQHSIHKSDSRHKDKILKKKTYGTNS